MVGRRHPHLITMNQHFRQQGFGTIGLGKVYHGTSGKGVDLNNWDQWINLEASEYAKKENNDIARDARLKGEIGNARDPAKGPLTESADVHDNTYADGKRAARVVELLQVAEAKDKAPFFLAVGLSKPHLPFVAPQSTGIFINVIHSRCLRIKEFPGCIPNTHRITWHMKCINTVISREKPQRFSDQLNGRLLHGYAACVSYIDASIGRILNSLEETGLSKNTIVVVVNHGWKLGDHSSWCKHTNFECDTRVLY